MRLHAIAACAIMVFCVFAAPAQAQMKTFDLLSPQLLGAGSETFQPAGATQRQVRDLREQVAMLTATNEEMGKKMLDLTAPWKEISPEQRVHLAALLCGKELQLREEAAAATDRQAALLKLNLTQYRANVLASCGDKPLPVEPVANSDWTSEKQLAMDKLLDKRQR